MRQRFRFRRSIAAVTAIAIGSTLALFGVAAPAQAAGYTVTGGISIPGTITEHGRFSPDLSTLSVTPTPTSATLEIYSDGALAGSIPIDFPGGSNSFELYRGFAGYRIQVVLVLDGPGGELRIPSNTSDPVLAEGLRPASLSIAGSGIARDPFTVQTDSPWGSTPASVHYTWHRVDTDAVLQSGTSPSYTPTGVLVGTSVYVVATASRGSLPTASSTSSVSATVRLQEFANVPTPTISGSGKLGTDFTVNVDTTSVTPTPRMMVVFWHRADTGEMVQLGGSTFTPMPALLGTGVYAIVTLVADDTKDYTTLSSAFSATVRLNEFENVPSPTVTGTGEIGSDFTADLDTSAVTPTPSAVEYVWHRVDTGAVVQAGGTTFTATSALRGTGVYVIATLRAQDTGPYVTLNSAFSATVRYKEFTNVPAPTVSGSGALGSAFNASLGTSSIAPTPSAVLLTWHRADTHAVVQTGGTSFMPTRDLLGTGVYVIATLSADDTAPYVTTNSAFSNTVHRAPFTPGAAPVLAGQHTLGGELSAVIDTTGWSPVPASFSYQWFLEDGTAIVGATAAALAMTDSLVGEVVYVVATAAAADHQPYEIASAPSGRIARPTLAVDGLANAVPGGSVTLRGWGLLFGEDVAVELHSTPTGLGTFTVGADGTLSASVTVPALTELGLHHLVVLRNGVEIGRVALTVSAPELSATGHDADALGSLAIAAVLALGLGVALLARRRVSGEWRRGSAPGTP